MPQDATVVSTNEKEFIIAALKEDVRVDGRRPFDMRHIKISFGKQDGTAEVQLGVTRVMAVVTGELVPPYPERPNEGFFSIQTEFSPMADPSFEPGRPGEAAIELGRIVDRGLRESRALDTEALCVVTGRAVWSLRLDIQVLDNGGNLVDAANIASLAGLLSYRRPECSLGGPDGQEIIVHPPEVREPIALSIHHLPIAVTFAFFGNGDLVVLDPSLKEEAAMGGRMTVIANIHREICGVQKGGGVGIRVSEILRFSRIACNKAADITALIKAALGAFEVDRAQAKVRRHPKDSSKFGSGLRDVVIDEAELSRRAGDTEDADNMTPVSTGLEEEMQSGDEGDEDEDMEDESEDEESEEEESGEMGREEMEEGGTPVVKVKEERGGGVGKAGLFSGGASSWLGGGQVAQSQRKDQRGRRPPDEDAMDEFEAVANLISTAKVDTKVVLRGGNVKSEDATVVKVKLKAEEGLDVHRQEFAPDPWRTNSTMGAGESVLLKRDGAGHVDETLLAAVKKRGTKKSKKG